MSTAGEAKSAAASESNCRLLSLPSELLGKIVARVRREEVHYRYCDNSLQQSCRAMENAVFAHWPRLSVRLNEDQHPNVGRPILSSKLVRALRTRQSKLEVTLDYYQSLYPEDGGDGGEYDNGCITEVLKLLSPCPAIQRLSLESETHEHTPTQHLSWPKSRTRLLRKCCPSLTALSVSEFVLGSGALAGLVDVCRKLGLQQLHVSQCKMKEPHEREGVAVVPLGNVFRGCRLQKLSLDVWWRAMPPPSLRPLALHLTHLTLALPDGYESAEDCLPLLQGMGQLQVLHLTMPVPLPPPRDVCGMEPYDDRNDDGNEEEEDQEYDLDFSGLPQLVQSLPCLQSLRLPLLILEPQDMESLLAITQLTHITPLLQSRLQRSYADSACSWRHLDRNDIFIPDILDNLAHLPLHALTHPLHIPELLVDANHLDLDLAKAALENLASRCTVPVTISSLTLRCPTAPDASCTDGDVQLAVVEALLAQLQPIFHATSIVKVTGLHSVTPHTARALAPACRAASRVILQGGLMAPGVEVWLELLRCMPAMTQLDITGLGSHLGYLDEGLRQLRLQPPKARRLEVSLWAPGAGTWRFDTSVAGLPRPWRQLVSGRGFPKISLAERSGSGS
ncbi:hypothetical protein V8C86DRAFT_2649370 [Haematococcus lacustris]